MAVFFIFHGTKGHPQENWFPWIKHHLVLLGHEVIIPAFPTPEKQSLENWLKVLEPYHAKLNKSTVLAHSLGVPFLLNVLDRWDIEIKSAYLVGGFISDLGIKYDNINRSFVNKKLDFSSVRSKCRRFNVISSDNDPYVPLEKGKELAEKLNVNLHLIRNAGHFNAEAGFREFPQLLDMIKKELQSA